MAPYYLFLTIICFGALFHQRLGRDGKVILFFIWFALTLFAGLRFQNADWINYSELFEQACKNEKLLSSDFGFNILLRVLSLLSNESVIMFLTVAGISVALNLESFKRYTPYVFISLLLYFVHNYVLKEMIQIRVGLASSICLYSIYYLKRNNYKMTLLYWLLAISIHVTVIIFGLPILMYRLKPTKKILLFALFASIIIGSFCPLGSIIKEQIGLDGRLDEYIAYGDSGYAGALGIWKNANTLKTLLFFLFFYCLYNRLICRNEYFYLLFLTYTIGLCWLICFNDFAIIGARMSNILLSVEPILLTYPLAILHGSNYRFYQISLILLALFMFSMNIMPDKITPYKFYLTYLM